MRLCREAAATRVRARYVDITGRLLPSGHGHQQGKGGGGPKSRRLTQQSPITNENRERWNIFGIPLHVRLSARETGCRKPRVSVVCPRLVSVVGFDVNGAFVIFLFFCFDVRVLIRKMVVRCFLHMFAFERKGTLRSVCNQGTDAKTEKKNIITYAAHTLQKQQQQKIHLRAPSRTRGKSACETDTANERLSTYCSLGSSSDDGLVF